MTHGATETQQEASDRLCSLPEPWVGLEVLRTDLRNAAFPLPWTRTSVLSQYLPNMHIF